MAIFKDIETRLENLFEGFFNKKFSSALEPVELAHKLTAEMDRKRQVSVAHVYAPNIFSVTLAVTDFSQVEGFKAALLNELKDYLTAHVKEKNYSLTGDIKILFTSEPELQSGECQVVGRLEEDVSNFAGNNTQAISVEEVQSLMETPLKVRFYSSSLDFSVQLRKKVITIGRRADNDIVLNKPGVSRYHARLERSEGTYRLHDLDSTNGTLVNGKEIGQINLFAGDEIVFGDVSLEYQVED